MAYETLSVRMSRSSADIPWGFSLRQGNRRLEVASVARESLAEKAGLQVGDEVDEVQGRRATAAEADSLVRAPSLDISLSLQRFAASPPVIPWTLTEKNNQLVVEDATTGRPFSSGAPFGSSSFKSATSHSSWEDPNFRGVGQFNASNGFSSHTQNNYGYNTTSSTSPRERTIPVQTSPRNYSTRYETTNSSFSRTETRPDGANSSISRPAWSTLPSGQPSSLPFNQPATINTNTSAPSLEGLHSSRSQTTPTGPRVLYHSPSPRSRRELSPHATVHHLQYNSPMNLYSVESAAEQFRQQTGGTFGDPFTRPDSRGQSQSPAYLTSETRRLIAERESGGRLRRGPSPSTQSASFKRISNACGTPVD